MFRVVARLSGDEDDDAVGLEYWWFVRWLKGLRGGVDPVPIVLH
jgi:hypothetical protein